MPMGNLIKNVIAEYDNAPIDEIEERTVFNLQLLYQNFSDNPKLFTSILHSCINMAVGKKGSVNAKEDRFIKKIFKRITKPGQTVDTSVYSQKQSEAEKKFLELVGSGQAYGGAVGMAALRVILGFAFSDGILENDLAYQLETMFANCMVIDFFSGNEESVPVAGELISGLEVEIVEWLDEDDLGKSDELYKHFSSYPRKQIQDALMSLVNKGIISKVDTYVGTLYSLTGSPYRIANSESVSKNPGYRKDPEDLLETIDFPVTKAIEGTGYEGRAQRFEKVHENDELILKADWNSRFYTPAAVEVFNAKGETLGYLADNGGRPNLGELAELVDSNLVKASVQSVTPLSKRRKNAKYALMDVLIERNDTAHSADEKEVPQESESKGERRIVLDNNLVIYIPEGMNVSEKRFTTGSGISRLLTAATSDLSLKKRDNLDSPFDANRNITVNSMDVLGQLFMTQFDEKERIEQLKGFLGQGSKSIKNNGLNIIYLISSNQTIMMIFARDFLYMCQYFINDVKGKSKINQLVNDFIDKLELFDPKSSGIKTSIDHSVPSEPAKKTKTTTGNKSGKSRKTQKAKTITNDSSASKTDERITDYIPPKNISTGSSKKTGQSTTLRKVKHLNEFRDSNDSGRIDGLKALELFSECVVSVGKDDFRTFGRHELTGLNLRSIYSEKYKTVVKNWDEFKQAIIDLSEYVNDNDDLIVPSELIDPGLDEVTFGYDMYGSALFKAAEEKLLRITENGSDYIVEVADVLIHGIPKAEKYIAEFIRTLRKFNDRNSSFTVTFESMNYQVISRKRKATVLQVSGEVYIYHGVISTIHPDLRSKLVKYNEAKRLIRQNDPDSLDKGVLILKEIEEYADAPKLLKSAEKKRDMMAARKEKRLRTNYEKGMALLAKDDTILKEITKAKAYFEKAESYADAEKKIRECDSLIASCRTYDSVNVSTSTNDMNELKKAISLLETIRGYKDTNLRIKDYQFRLQVLEEAEEKRRRSCYEHGIAYLEKENQQLEDVINAKKEFIASNQYRNAQTKIKECDDLVQKYNLYSFVNVPEDSSDIAELESAVIKLAEIKGFKDTDQRIQKYNLRIQQLKEEIQKIILAEAAAQKKKKKIKAAAIILVLILLAALIYYVVVSGK